MSIVLSLNEEGGERTESLSPLPLLLGKGRFHLEDRRGVVKVALHLLEIRNDSSERIEISVSENHRDDLSHRLI